MDRLSKGGNMAYRLYISEEADQSIQRFMPANRKNRPLNAASSCSVSMLVERMLGLSFPPDICAQFAISSGATTDSSDISFLAGAISGRFSLRLLLCQEEEAFELIQHGGKAIIQYHIPSEIPRRYYLFDEIRASSAYIVNPSIQQGKGMPRNKKRLIQIRDDYMIIPLEHYREFFPENALYFVFLSQS